MLDPSNQAHAKAAERLRAEPVAWPTTVRADRVDYSTPIRARPTRVRVW